MPAVCTINRVVLHIGAGAKQGSDQLFVACDIHGGFIMSSSLASAANRNGGKKFTGDKRSTTVASRVICIQRLPRDVTEGEVTFLWLPFGKVTNLLMLKRKNQASTERNTEEAANTMVNTYTLLTKLSLNGQDIYNAYYLLHIDFFMLLQPQCHVQQ
ncbi:Polypyrimidine tract-binding protein 1 [Plecturocebus cupreus]